MHVKKPPRSYLATYQKRLSSTATSPAASRNPTSPNTPTATTPADGKKRNNKSPSPNATRIHHEDQPHNGDEGEEDGSDVKDNAVAPDAHVSSKGGEIVRSALYHAVIDAIDSVSSVESTNSANSINSVRSGGSSSNLLSSDNEGDNNGKEHEEGCNYGDGHIMDADSVANAEEANNSVDFIVLSLKRSFVDLSGQQIATFIQEDQYSFRQEWLCETCGKEKESSVIAWLSEISQGVATLSALILHNPQDLSIVFSCLIVALRVPSRNIVHRTLQLFHTIMNAIPAPLHTQAWKWFAKERRGVKEVVECFLKFPTDQSIVRSLVLLIDDFAHPTNQYFNLFSADLKTSLRTDPLTYMKFLNNCLEVWKTGESNPQTDKEKPTNGVDINGSGTDERNNIDTVVTPKQVQDGIDINSNENNNNINESDNDNSTKIETQNVSNNTNTTSSSFKGKDSIIQCNLVNHLIFNVIHYAKADAKATRDKSSRRTQLEAIKALALIWEVFDDYISRTEKLREEVQGGFQACTRSSSFHVQRAAIDRLLHLLSHFLNRYKNDHSASSDDITTSSAMDVYKRLLFVILENHPNDSVSYSADTNLREYVMAGLSSGALASPSFPPLLLEMLINVVLRQMWICGYSNSDFDLLLTIADHPQIGVPECLQILKFLCLVMGEDTIYSSAATIACIHIAIRFYDNSEVFGFMEKFFRQAIPSIACMEAARIEEDSLSTKSFATTKAREVHVTLRTDTISKFIQMANCYHPLVKGILRHVIDEFAKLYNQPPDPLTYLLQRFDQPQPQQRPKTSHFMRGTTTSPRGPPNTHDSTPTTSVAPQLRPLSALPQQPSTVPPSSRPPSSHPSSRPPSSHPSHPSSASRPSSSHPSSHEQHEQTPTPHHPHPAPIDEPPIITSQSHDNKNNTTNEENTDDSAGEGETDPFALEDEQRSSEGEGSTSDDEEEGGRLDHLDPGFSDEDNQFSEEEGDDFHLREDAEGEVGAMDAPEGDGTDPNEGANDAEGEPQEIGGPENASARDNEADKGVNEPEEDGMEELKIT